MTTLTKDIAAKFAVAAVAVAMIFSAYAPAAQAQTTEDLQQMINDLLAQVAQLQAQAGGDVSAPAGAPAVCPYTWTRDLTMGSEGADVMKLQQFLNSYPDLRVAAAGSPGSAGMETMYYGPATAAAVSKMQVMFRAEVLTPNGLVNPTGYFGPSSRSKANDLCVANTTTEEVDDAEEGTEEEEEEGDMTLRGEGTLDTFEWDDEETDLEENDEDVAIAIATLEADDGDIEIARMEFRVDENTATEDAWDVFETFSLWVDGDMIAEMDASDEDEYLDEDRGTFRFTNLDLFVEEGEEVEVYLAVSVQSNVDDLPESFDFTAEEIRYFDADGVAITESVLGDLGGDSPVNVTVDEEGADEELTLSTASNNPDSTDIIVDTDSDTDDVTIAIGDMEAEENDIELQRVVVLVEVSGVDVSSNVVNTEDVIDEIRFVMDGEEFEAESVRELNAGSITGETQGDSLDLGRSENVDGTTADIATWYVFDIDGDIVIDEDDEMSYSIVVDFKDNDDGERYGNGTKIEVTVGDDELAYWEAEGADDLSFADGNLDGSLNGEEHTLIAEGIVVPVDGVDTDTDTVGDGTTQLGEFTITFDVTAVEDDFYIVDSATTTGEATDGIGYTLVRPSGAADPDSLSATLSSTGDEDTGVFKVEKGETETFTLTVSVDPAAGGQYRVRLDDVFYTANSAGTGTQIEYSTIPAQDYRTAFQTIQ